MTLNQSATCDDTFFLIHGIHVCRDTSSLSSHCSQSAAKPAKQCDKVKRSRHSSRVQLALDLRSQRARVLATRRGERNA